MADWAAAGRVAEIAGAFVPHAASPSADAGEYELAPAAPPQPAVAPATAWQSPSYGYPAQQPVGPYGQPTAVPGGVLPYGTYAQTMPQQMWWYGGFWLRVVATIIDAIILWVPNTVIQLLGQAITPQLAGGPAFTPPVPGGRPMFPGLPPPAFWAAMGVVWFGQVAVAWLFEALFVASKFQATPGKLAVGLRVVNANGGRLSFGHATGRHFAKILSSMICGIGYLMVAFDERKRGLHDMICTTFVVKK
jgi:uncharacterized RDD family membrane protein YckC